MTISELSRRSGTPTATVKYYIREGLIAGAKKQDADGHDFDQDAVDRLKLIKGLVHVVGLSISQVRQILAIMSDLNQWPFQAMARATETLPLCGAGRPEASLGPERDAELSASLDDLGFHGVPDLPYVRQTKAAMALAQECGVGVDDAHLGSYAAAAREVAQADFAHLPLDNPARALQAAVLGTTIYEPILLGLRRLAHREAAETASASGKSLAFGGRSLHARSV
jgi:DNA-binding transcriptional MerR regulator